MGVCFLGGRDPTRGGEDDTPNRREKGAVRPHSGPEDVCRFVCMQCIRALWLSMNDREWIAMLTLARKHNAIQSDFPLLLCVLNI